MFSPVSKDWYINSFFDNKNKKDCTQIKEKDNNIVIINIKQSSSSRCGFASIFKALGGVSSKCIAIDILMEEDNDPGNDSLTSVMNELNEKTNLVVAAAYKNENNTVLQSFFNRDNNIKYGIINKESLLDLKTTYKNYPTFAAKIAQSIGVPTQFEGTRIVNFRFNKIRIKDVRTIQDVEESKAIFKDKVLIVGSTEDLNDYKELPFVLDHINQTAGCVVMAYELSSLLNLNTNDVYKTPFKEAGQIFNIIFCSIALLIYVLFIEALSTVSKKIFNIGRERSRMRKIIKSFVVILGRILLLLFAQWCVIKLCMFFTETFLVIPSIYLFAISLIFFLEIYMEIKNISIKYTM